MKTISYIVLLAIMTFLTGIFLPQWWFVIFVAFLCALIFKEGIWKSGLISLVVVLAVWMSMALFIDSNNESILSTRVGNLFGGLSPLLLALVSGVIGGIVSMFGAMTGASLLSMMNKHD